MILVSPGPKSWYFSDVQLKNTPSVQSGDLCLETDHAYRRELASFIQNMGQSLKL